MTRPKIHRPRALGTAKQSRPTSPNWILNWTEKNKPKPHIQERATELPQRMALNQRGKEVDAAFMAGNGLMISAVAGLQQEQREMGRKKLEVGD